MVCENNVDDWCRAAFFEETGETYKKVVAACLRPQEQLTSNLSEVLEGCYVDKAHQLSNQLQLPTDSQLDSKHYESLNNFQVWKVGTDDTDFFNLNILFLKCLL
jgi:nucleoporin NDC1